MALCCFTCHRITESGHEACVLYTLWFIVSMLGYFIKSCSRFFTLILIYHCPYLYGISFRLIQLSRVENGVSGSFTNLFEIKYAKVHKYKKYEYGDTFVCNIVHNSKKNK